MLKVIPPSGTPLNINALIKSYFLPFSYNLEPLKKYLSEGEIFFTSSGRMALYLILKSLRKIYPTKDKVIISAYTCPVVVEVIKSLGLRILLADLEENSLFMEREKVENLYDENTLCIIPAHLFGYPHPIWDEFLCVEDAAQAFGAENRNGKVGMQGIASFFSLGKGKNITADKGGIIFTRNEKIIYEIKKEIAYFSPLSPFPSLLRLLLFSIAIKPSIWGIIYHTGMPREESSKFIIEKRKLSSFHKKVFISQLENYPEVLLERKKNASLIGKFLKGFPQVKLFSPLKGSRPCYLRFPILVKNKRKVLKNLFVQRGFEVTTMYKKSIPEIYPSLYFNKGDKFPHAYKLSRELLTLPTLGYKEEKIKKDLNWIMKKFKAKLK